MTGPAEAGRDRPVDTTDNGRIVVAAPDRDPGRDPDLVSTASHG